MYKDIFSQLGLSTKEALVYEFLLKNGETSAGVIIKKTPLKRGVIYNTLNNLIKIGLVSQKTKNKIAYFIPNHPERLRKYLEEKEDSLYEAKNTLEANLPSIISDFNLVSGRPGVRVYEGIEGVKKTLNDTLINNKEGKILTFSDVAGYATYLKDWNIKYYAPQRQKLKIQEKVIIPDNAKALDYMKGYESTEVTEILFIDHNLYPFKTEINIYDHKISFVTFSDRGHIGVIIENQEIVNTLTSIFNFTWKLGQKYCQNNQPDWLKKLY